jgi:hypothetical protein
MVTVVPLVEVLVEYEKPLLNVGKTVPCVESYVYCAIVAKIISPFYPVIKYKVVLDLLDIEL